jgi:hypothetical protein
MPKSWQRPVIGVFVAIYAVYGACSSFGFTRWIPSPVQGVFSELGLNQRWDMFVGASPWRNNFDRLTADVRMADGRTLRWEVPSDSWRWFFQQPHAERVNTLINYLFHRASRARRDQFVRYVARQFEEQGKPISVDLWVPPGGRDYPIFNPASGTPLSYPPHSEEPRYLVKGFTDL